jgi:hypothetical protein
LLDRQIGDRFTLEYPTHMDPDQVKSSPGEVLVTAAIVAQSELL